ncbi:response regulator transcription factor [Streptomyces sp. NPDC091272]|uniref:response regulator transcription factor n=1 Tax=Streptomyces sp. NPDC091272 TaxID=3365981 RepID=UPI0037F4163B
MTPEQVRDVVHGNAENDACVVVVSRFVMGRVEGGDSVLPTVLAAAAEALERNWDGSGNSTCTESELPGIVDGGRELKRVVGSGKAGEDTPCAAAQSPQLSTREKETLLLVADGLTRNQVARRIGISPHTIDTYLKRIRAKLGLGNKAELARAAERYRS